MNLKKSGSLNIIKKLFNLALILGIILMLGTVARVSAYTVFVSDDFWHAKNAGALHEGFLAQLKGAWEYNTYMYLNHQGAYSLFFLALFNPVSSTGFAGLRIIMIINALFFFFTVLLLVKSFFRVLSKDVDSSILLLVMFTVVFVMTQYDAFAETFYWYTGATNYSFPVAFMNLVFVILFSLQTDPKKHSTLLTILAVIFAFLAAGGVLPIGGTMCYVALLVILYEKLSGKRLNINILIIFIASFVSTLLNAIAPGYRIRQGIESSDKATLTDAIGYTLDVAISYTKWLFISKNYILILFTFILCGAFISWKAIQNKKAYVITSLLGIAIPFITIFPVVYGYSAAWLPNRCVFITIFTVDLVFGNLAFILGSFGVAKLNDLKVNKVVYATVFALVFAVLAITNSYPPTEYTVAKINKQLYDRGYQEYYAYIRETFDELKNHQGEAVELSAPSNPDEMRNFYTFFLTDDPDNKINKGVAWAYGLKSVSRVPD